MPRLPRTVRIESRTNLLFSFEKMALYTYLHGREDDESRFNAWRDVVGQLPRHRTRVLTWPVYGIVLGGDARST